jgi:hypothetical protein
MQRSRVFRARRSAVDQTATGWQKRVELASSVGAGILGAGRSARRARLPAWSVALS